MIYINIVILVVVGPPESDTEKGTPEDIWVEPEGSNGLAHGFAAHCKKCGWLKPYPTPARAKMALGAHSRFCKGVQWRVSPFSKPF